MNRTMARQFLHQWVQGIALVLLLIGIGACNDNVQKAVDVPPEKTLYDAAMQKLDANNYVAAISDLELLESRYPFGRYSIQAQLELIYAYYRTKQTLPLQTTAERFIRLNPDYEYLDYVYYLKGLSAFEENKGLFDDYIVSNKAKRDPGAMRDSFVDFNTIQSRFPQSQYAADAKARMVYLRNLLAEHEIHVAQYYLSREAWLAAANRAQYVLQNYQLTPSVEDALLLLITAYEKLGLTDNADNARQVLAVNFPDYSS